MPTNTMTGNEEAQKIIEYFVVCVFVSIVKETA